MGGRRGTRVRRASVLQTRGNPHGACAGRRGRYTGDQGSNNEALRVSHHFTQPGDMGRIPAQERQLVVFASIRRAEVPSMGHHADQMAPRHDPDVT